MTDDVQRDEDRTQWIVRAYQAIFVGSLSADWNHNKNVERVVDDFHMREQEDKA